MDLLMITNKNKSHYVYIKDFDRFKNTFAGIVYKKRKGVLVERKKVCLEINGKQTVKLRNGSMKFKNHFKQLAVSFKIYTNFECNVKRVKSSNTGDRGDRGDNTSYTEKKIKNMLIAVLLIKSFVLMINSVNQLFFVEIKMQFINSLMQFLKSIIMVKE